VDWPARFQRLTGGPLGHAAAQVDADLWLDGGHNPHAGRALARAAAALTARDGRPLTLVVGMLANKDAEGFLTPFAELAPKVIAVTFPGNAAPAYQIAEAAMVAGLKVQTCEDGVEAAVALALADRPAPHVIIAGSLHLAGAVLGLDQETWPR
jgi:dihydrofolate synthase/folylpolyglutamate synthase